VHIEQQAPLILNSTDGLLESCARITEIMTHTALWGGHVVSCRCTLIPDCRIREVFCEGRWSLRGCSCENRILQKSTGMEILDLVFDDLWRFMCWVILLQLGSSLSCFQQLGGHAGRLPNAPIRLPGLRRSRG